MRKGPLDKKTGTLSDYPDETAQKWHLIIVYHIHEPTECCINGVNSLPAGDDKSRLLIISEL